MARPLFLMILIGISRKKRSGKDTFIQMLAQNTEHPVVRRAFADALKDEVYRHVLEPNGLDRSLLDSDADKEKFRLLLRWWGTEFRRQLFSDHYGLDRMDDALAQYQDCIVAVPDVRFPNEFDHIRQRGGVLIRIERPSLALDQNSQHPSGSPDRVGLCHSEPHARQTPARGSSLRPTFFANLGPQVWRFAFRCDREGKLNTIAKESPVSAILQAVETTINRKTKRLVTSWRPARRSRSNTPSTRTSWVSSGIYQVFGQVDPKTLERVRD